MTEVIKIFNPKDKPFGSLSNNYKHFMRIDRKEWLTVSGYVYSNILVSPTYKQMIRLMKNTQGVKNEFIKLYEEEINDIIKKSTEEGLKVKLENEKLAELLISTKDSPILYVSSNELLGTGNQNKGQNIYGKYLMQARHLLKIAYKQQKEKIEKSEKDQIIYETYLAEKGLVKSLNSGNDIMEFLNIPVSEIVDKLGRENLILAAPKREYILESTHKGYLKNIEPLSEHPENLVLEVKKKHLRNLRMLRLKERKSILLDMYANYILEKHYEDLDSKQYNKAKKQQFDKLDYEQKTNLENRLYHLFEQGMLSSRLSDAFDQRMLTFYIPSEEEVIEAENVVISYNDKQKVIETSYIPQKGTPILVYPTDYPGLDTQYKPYTELSPLSYTGMLKLYGNNYPTIVHFTITRLLSHIPDLGGINKAYEYILADPTKPVTGLESFLHPNTASLNYENIRDIKYNDNLQKYVKIALDKKFEDRVMQDVLISTGNNKLEWNDYSDPVLGVGPKDYKSGNNFVGKYLMEIRAKILKVRQKETLHQLKTDHITLILKEDPIMKDWLLMRVRDMCKVILLIKKYIEHKDSTQIEINTKFVSVVLDKIYQPCSHVFGASDRITAPVPDYFRLMVINYPGFKNISDDVIEILWKRLAVMIYYLIEHLKETSIQNLKVVLGRIELMVSSETSCIDILPEENDNCIISAIINIIKGLSEFNNLFSFKTNIDLLEVKTAANIILNSDISTMIDSDTPVDLEDVVYIPKDQEDLDPDLPEDTEDPEDPEEFIFPDDDDDDEKEIDYDEFSDIHESFSPKENLLISVLQEIDNIENVEELAHYITKIVKIIKKYPLSKQIKQNRINFFATQRS